MKINKLILFIMFVFFSNSTILSSLRIVNPSQKLLEYEFKQNLCDAYDQLKSDLDPSEILHLSQSELAEKIRYKFRLNIKEKCIFADVIQKIVKVEAEGLIFDSVIDLGTSKVVLKVIENEKAYALLLYLDVEGKKENFFRELNILKNYKHSNVIGLIDYNKEYFLILEELAVCDLFKLLMSDYLRINNVKLSFKDKINFAKDIVNAIYHLHKNNIIYRDLKLENVLIVKNETGGYTAKLTDFSFSQELEDRDSILEDVALQGSLYYLSPESIHCYLNGYLSTKTTNACLADDIFALGVVVLNVFSWGYMETFYKNEYKVYKTSMKKLQYRPKNYIFFVFDKITLKDMPNLEYLNMNPVLKKIVRKCWKPFKNRARIPEIHKILFSNF